MKNRKANAFALLSAIAMVTCGPSQAKHAPDAVAVAARQPNCPAAPASIKQKFGPEIPSSARLLGIVFPNEPTILDVFVDAGGRPGTIRIVKSSGSATMDKVAMRAAKETDYSPASRDCKYRAQHFQFVEDWQQLQRELKQ